MPDKRTFYVARYSRWSPDGSLLLGWQRDQEGKAEATLNTFNADSQTYSKVAELPRFQLFNWLPDSRRILLMSRDELTILDRITGAITPAGSAPRMIDFGDVVQGPGNAEFVNPAQ